MSVDTTVQTKNYEVQGGDKWVVSGELDIESGGKITAAGTQAVHAAALTDNSSGTSGGDTIAAVTDVATAADAIATLAAKLNAIIAAVEGVGITAAS